MATVELLENAAALIELLTRVLFEDGLQHMYKREMEKKQKVGKEVPTVSSDVNHVAILHKFFS